MKICNHCSHTFHDIAYRQYGNRCPICGSESIKDLTKEEYERIQRAMFGV